MVYPKISWFTSLTLVYYALFTLVYNGLHLIVLYIVFLTNIATLRGEAFRTTTNMWCLSDVCHTSWVQSVQSGADWPTTQRVDLWSTCHWRPAHPWRVEVRCWRLKSLTVRDSDSEHVQFPAFSKALFVLWFPVNLSVHPESACDVCTAFPS